jgi:WD40 repeat protein
MRSDPLAAGVLAACCLAVGTVAAQAPTAKSQGPAPRLHLEHQAFAVAFSGDGEVLASADNSTVHLWNVRTGKSLDPAEGLPSGGQMVFGPDGKVIAIADSDGKVTVFDLAKGAPLESFTVGSAGAPSMGFSTDGKTLLIAGAQVEAWLLGSDAQAITFAATKDEMPRTAFSPDRQTVARWGDKDDVTLWKVSGRSRVQTLKAGTGYRAVALSNDGKVAVGSAPSGPLTIWDAAKGTVVRTIPTGGAVTAVALSPDGKWIATGGFSDVKLWDALTGAASGTFPYGTSVSAVAISPDGKSLAATGGIGVDVWDLPAR